MNLSRRTLARGIVRLLLELVIVFVGVYLAFLFNEYRANAEQASRQGQLREALASEIDVFIQGADRMLPVLDSLVDRWDSAYAAGAHPGPLEAPSGGVDMPPRGMWQAVIASDPLSTLDVATMQSVSEFYNALDVLIEKYDRLRAFDEASIVAYADDGRMAFYKPGSTALRPEYRAYMSRFHDVVSLFRSVRSLGAESRNKLSAPPPS